METFVRIERKIKPSFTRTEENDTELMDADNVYACPAPSQTFLLKYAPSSPPPHGKHGRGSGPWVLRFGLKRLPVRAASGLINMTDPQPRMGRKVPRERDTGGRNLQLRAGGLETRSKLLIS